jgi:hypothetical protein
MVTKVTKKRTSLDWLFLVFITIALPVIVLLGYRAYQEDLAQEVGASSRLTQEIQIQELEHRIRSEQSRGCILDAIDALSRDEPVPRLAECESDVADLLEALERANERPTD